MCGTSTVGQTFQTPVTSTSTNTTQVAGAKGNATQVAGATGGGGDMMAQLAPLLAQITTAIQALIQALQGNAALGGGHGAHDAKGGCDMMGGGAGGDSTAVADANGGADAIDATGGGHGAMAGCDSMGGATAALGKSEVDGEDGEGEAAPAKKDSEVDGAGGSGAPDKKGSGVGGADGAGAPPKKGSAVDGESGNGDVKQVGPTPEQTAVQKSTSALDAAKAESTKQAEAVKAADAAVVEKASAVTAAEGKLKDAEAAKVTADKALVDAGAAVTAAKNGNGEHAANGSETLDDIAKKYGTTVSALQALNPSITVLGSLPAGTKVKLPAGIGVEKAVAAAEAKLTEARAGATAAKKALDDAIAALNAAREALKAAEAAAKSAKEAAEKAAKAVEDAQKALDEATAAAAKAAEEAKKAAPAGSTEQTGAVAQTPAQERMARVIAEATAAQGDDAKLAVFHRITAEAGVTPDENAALLGAVIPMLTAAKQEELSRFFAGLAASNSSGNGGTSGSGKGSGTDKPTGSNGAPAPAPAPAPAAEPTPAPQPVTINEDWADDRVVVRRAADGSLQIGLAGIRSTFEPMPDRKGYHARSLEFTVDGVRYSARIGFDIRGVSRSGNQPFNANVLFVKRV